MAHDDFQIGPVHPKHLGAFAPQAPSPTWGTALAKLGRRMGGGPPPEESRPRRRRQRNRRRRSGGADGLLNFRKGATIPGLAARDPAIIGDTEFRSWWKEAAAERRRKPPASRIFSTSKGRPIAQRGPKGRTFAHPLAPEPEGPAPQRRIIKGPDNLNYYEDTKERVLPNVAAPTAVS